MNTIKVRGYDERNHPTKFELEVLPCPFCGGEELSIQNHSVCDSWGVLGRISCDQCDVDGPDERGSYTHCDKDLKSALEDVKAKAIRSWNQRVNSPPEKSDV